MSIGGEAGPAEERRIRGLLLRLYPRHLLGAVPLVFSWELLGGDRDDIRRTWSSLLNAFLHPAMERFLFNTQQRLRSTAPADRCSSSATTAAPPRYRSPRRSRLTTQARAGA